jgi:hypothetical protein
MTLQSIGNTPCTINKLAVMNYKGGKLINDIEETIYEDNTCYLAPVLSVKSNRKGNFKFGVKIYEREEERLFNYETCCYYSKYSWKYKGSYEDTVNLQGDKQKNIYLSGWGSDTPGSWKKGKYRFEIWWEGEMLYSKVFNIY